MSAVTHRRRFNGITLGPAKPSTKSPPKGKWKPLHDPLAKRSPQPAFPLENGYRRTIRQTLIMATDEDDIPIIKEAIDLFEKNRLEDKGDLTRAQEKLEYLNLKKGLYDAIHRRRFELLDRAINEARKSRFIDKLDPSPIRKAENLRDELACLDRYNHPILLLNKRTISELRRYTNPPEVIKATMAAAFLLLGECEENVEDWDYILGLLRRIGNGSVMLKVEHFDATNVPLERALKAESFLQNVNINSVRQASFGCAAFFMWARKAIAEVKATNKESNDITLYETEL